MTHGRFGRGPLASVAHGLAYVALCLSSFAFLFFFVFHAPEIGLAWALVANAVFFLGLGLASKWLWGR